jgi:hypothetical protein
MVFTPWAQQPAVPPSAPQKAPPKEEKSWWEQGMERFKKAGGFTMPWQAEHWTAPQPAWTRHVGKAGLGLGLTSLGALGGMAVAPALAGASSALPWLTGPALAAMAHPTALAVGGGLGGLIGSSVMAPGGIGEPGTAGPPVPPPAAPAPPAPPEKPPTLPTPGEVREAAEPIFFTDETGQRWVYNEYTGEWSPVQPPRVPGLTPEQEMQQTEAQRAHQMEMLRLQFELEREAMEQQAGAARGQQEAAAAQQMAQMYAADPYKYWAQMGMGTPPSVARLTGGQIAPGEQMGQVPLSMPSSQWWGNLLPSEQQQISGGLNWLGIDPQDWYSMYQRMIPGLGRRQMGPTWAR